MPNKCPVGYRTLEIGELMTSSTLYYSYDRTIRELPREYWGQPWGRGYVTMYVPAITPQGNIISNEL